MYPKFDVEFTATSIHALTPAGKAFLADLETADFGTDSTPSNYSAANKYSLQISFSSLSVRDWVTAKVRNGSHFGSAGFLA